MSELANINDEIGCDGGAWKPAISPFHKPFESAVPLEQQTVAGLWSGPAHMVYSTQPHSGPQAADLKARGVRDRIGLEWARRNIGLE